MPEPILTFGEDARTLAHQTRTARRWTSPLLITRLKTRADGRTAVTRLLTSFTKEGGISKSLARMFAQLPHLMREALAAEPSRSWGALVGHNTRIAQEEIKPLMDAFAPAALGRVKLREMFETAAADFQRDATQLEQQLEAETARFNEVQKEHRGIVQDLHANRFRFLQLLIRLFKGDLLTRLVNAINERESLALDIDVHHAAASLLAQTADAARKRGALLAAKADALARAEQAARTELSGLETRLHGKPPFLTHSADNWLVTQQGVNANPSGALPPSLTASLADASAPVETHLREIQEAAEQNASAQIQRLDILHALEIEARHLGIQNENDEQNPVVLVGEALLAECLENRPRYWLSPIAHPREFLFQIAPDSSAPFDLPESNAARLDAARGASAYLGFAHVQLGLAREDFEAYTQTRSAFLAAQKDHNLFVIEDLARGWTRRLRERKRVEPKPRRTRTPIAEPMPSTVGVSGDGSGKGYPSS